MANTKTRHTRAHIPNPQETIVEEPIEEIHTPSRAYVMATKKDAVKAHVPDAAPETVVTPSVEPKSKASRAFDSAKKTKETAARPGSPAEEDPHKLLRSQAHNAIKRGAPVAEVRLMFKKLSGGKTL
jgi:hypothetical protein